MGDVFATVGASPRAAAAPGTKPLADQPAVGAKPPALQSQAASTKDQIRLGAAARAAARPAPASRPPRLAVDPATLKTDAQIKAYLAPVFDRIAKAGHPDVANALRKAPFNIAFKSFLNVDFYANADFRGNVALSAANFFKLGVDGQAAILFHEGVHLQQSLAKRAGGNLLSAFGLNPKGHLAENEAYRKQWQFMKAIGLGETSPDNIAYFECRLALEAIGDLPKSD